MEYATAESIALLLTSGVMLLALLATVVYHEYVRPVATAAPPGSAVGGGASDRDRPLPYYIRRLGAVVACIEIVYGVDSTGAHGLYPFELRGVLLLSMQTLYATMFWYWLTFTNRSLHRMVNTEPAATVPALLGGSIVLFTVAWALGFGLYFGSNRTYPQGVIAANTLAIVIATCSIALLLVSYWRLRALLRAAMERIKPAPLALPPLLTQSSGAALLPPPIAGINTPRENLAGTPPAAVAAGAGVVANANGTGNGTGSRAPTPSGSRTRNDDTPIGGGSTIVAVAPRPSPAAAAAAAVLTPTTTTAVAVKPRRASAAERLATFLQGGTINAATTAITVAPAPTPAPAPAPPIVTVSALAGAGVGAGAAAVLTPTHDVVIMIAPTPTAAVAVTPPVTAAPATGASAVATNNTASRPATPTRSIPALTTAQSDALPMPSHPPTLVTAFSATPAIGAGAGSGGGGNTPKIGSARSLPFRGGTATPPRTPIGGRARTPPNAGAAGSSRQVWAGAVPTTPRGSAVTVSPTHASTAPHVPVDPTAHLSRALTKFTLQVVACLLIAGLLLVVFAITVAGRIADPSRVTTENEPTDTFERRNLLNYGLYVLSLVSITIAHP